MNDFKIPDNIIKVLTVLEENGFEAYVVGGSVRDMCRGVTPHDYDVTTSALPDETESCFDGWRVIETGIKHGTVTVVSDGDPVEITTYRTDGEYRDNRHPVSVSFTPMLSLDLSRRDFTVNAMAYSPKRGLVDEFGGRDDLDRRIIKCVGEPDRRFGEDGLRILRALRFASCLDFEIDGETAASILKNKRLLENISAERICSETFRLVTGAGAERILREYEPVMRLIIPSAFDGDYEASVSALGKCDADLILRLSLLLRTPDGVRDLVKLKSDGATQRAVRAVTSLCISGLTDKVSLRRALRRNDAENVLRAIEMMYVTGKTDASERDRLLELLKATENDCVTPSMLAVNGADIMSAGVAEGKAVGETLEKLLELVITDAVPNDKTALSEALRRLIHA